jgi:hypothetical protein
MEPENAEAKAKALTPVEVMTKCFAGLPLKKLNNLLDHAKAGTKICCGPDAVLYTDGLGGGCPATLAIMPDVPKVRIDAKEIYADETKDPNKVMGKLHPQGGQWITTYISMMFTDTNYILALAKASEDEVRTAIVAAAAMPRKDDK